MATVEHFEELVVWKLARELSIEIFELLIVPPISKDFKLRDQMSGSTGSVMDNIAEGFERGSKNEFVNFLSYSKGSLGELKSQVYRSFDRKYISEEKCNSLKLKIELLANKIGSLMIYLNKCIYKGLKFKNRRDEPRKPNSGKNNNNKGAGENEDLTN